MSWQIRLPVRNRAELIDAKSVAELPRYLDGDDRIVTSRLLKNAQIAFAGSDVSIGTLHDILADFTPAERRQILDALRVKSGLPSLADLEYERDQRLRVPDHRELELVLSPSGALVSKLDIEDETIRQQVEAASRAAQQQAKAAERAVEAEALRQHEAAVTEQIRRETPRGVPSP